MDLGIRCYLTVLIPSYMFFIKPVVRLHITKDYPNQAIAWFFFDIETCQLLIVLLNNAETDGEVYQLPGSLHVQFLPYLGLDIGGCLVANMQLLGDTAQ